MKIKIKREFVIGLTFVTGLFILVWGLNFMKGNKFFNHDRKFYALYKQVDGLVISNPVLVNGLRVGKVENIEFLSNNSAAILVEFSVNEDLKIPSNTIAQIFSSDIMGSKAIGLRFGDATTFASDKDTLKSAIQGSLQDAVNVQLMPLKAKAENLISSLDSVMSVIQYVFNESTRDNLSKSFENISLAIANLKHTTYNLDTLMSPQRNRLISIFSNVESITSNIRENNSQLANIIRNFSMISDSIAKSDLAHTIESADKTMTQTAQIMEKINKGEGSLGLLVNNDSLYNGITSSAAELNALIEDVKLHPRRYITISVFGKSGKRDKYEAPVKK